MFSVDFYKLSKRFIPYFLRKPAFVALLESAVTPLNELNSDFVDLVEQIDTKLQYTGQVIYLEEYLNSLYDAVQKRIFITDGFFNDFLFIYRKAELNPKTYIRRKSEGAAPTYLYKKTEINTQASYIINIPSDVVFDTNIITAQINQYNQAGAVYIINIF
jgi:hypothetical protein